MGFVINFDGIGIDTQGYANVSSFFFLDWIFAISITIAIAIAKPLAIDHGHAPYATHTTRIFNPFHTRKRATRESERERERGSIKGKRKMVGEKGGEKSGSQVSKGIKEAKAKEKR